MLKFPVKSLFRSKCFSLIARQHLLQNFSLIVFVWLVLVSWEYSGLVVLVLFCDAFSFMSFYWWRARVTAWGMRKKEFFWLNTHRYCYNSAVSEGSHHNLLQDVFLSEEKLTAVISSSYILIHMFSSVFHTISFPAGKCHTCESQGSLKHFFLSWEKQKHSQLFLLQRSHSFVADT